MKKMALFFSLLITIHSYACLNYVGVTVYGKQTMNETGPHSGHFLHGYSSQRTEKKELQKDILALKAILEKEPGNSSAKNDLAVDYIRTGAYEEARALLLDNYRLQPAQYAVNANLGVLYELLGQPDSALYFTERAWAINPDSHHGSEWIHLQILRLAEEPDQEQALRNYQLTNLNFGNGTVPDSGLLSYAVYFRPNRAGSNYKDSITLLVSHLEYQLSERTYFIKPPNKIVGELFFTLGDIYSLFYDSYWGLWAYTKALEYGTAHDELVRKRGRHLFGMVKKASQPGAGQHSATKKDYKKVISFWSKQKK